MNDKDIQIVIHAVDRSTPVIRSIERQVGGLGKSLQSALAGFAGGAGFAAVNALTSVLGTGLSVAMSKVGDAAIGLNARLEQAEIGFTTMLGSAEHAQSFLADLSTFAAKTPFEFPELVSASQRLLAFGFAAEKIIPILTDIGNASAALGAGSEGINRITNTLGQMAAKTRVQSEELLQLTEVGIPALQLLAEHMGLTTAATQEMVTAGEVSADTFIEAFQVFSRANYGDMMAKQSRTFSGAMSTIADSLNMAIAQGAQPFFERLSNLSVRIADFTSSDDFGAWADRFAAATDRAFSAGERFGEVGGEILAALKPVGELAPLMTTVAGVTVGSTQAMAGGWLLLTANMITGARVASETIGILADVAQVLSGEMSVGEAGGSIKDHFVGIGQAAVDSGRMSQEGMQLIWDALGTGQATTASLNTLLGDLATGTRALTEEQMLAAEHTAIAEATLRDYSETAAFVSDVNLDAALSAHELGAMALEAELNVAALASTVDVAAVMNQAFHNSVSDAGGAVSEWEQMLSGAEEALGHLQEKQDSGVELTDKEREQYDNLTWAVDRYKGGIEDDLVPALIDAESKRAEYFRGLDELNAQFRGPDGTIENQDAYNDAVFDLAAQTDPAIASQGSLKQAMEDLIGKIDGLLTKVQALIDKYGDVPPTVETEVTANTGPAEAAIAALQAQKRQIIIDIVARGGEPLKGQSGPTQFATGGTIPTDGMYQVHKDELLFLPGGTEVFNSGQARQLMGGASGGGGFTLSMDINIDPAIESIHELARYIPHSPAETGPFSQEPDWDWVFRGIEESIRARLDAAIEDADEFQAAFEAEMSDFDYWNFVFSNFDDIMSGDKVQELREQAHVLSEQLQFAIEENAPQAVIDGLRDAIAVAQQQINAAMEVSGSEAGRSFSAAMARAAAEEARKQAADDAFLGMLPSLDQIISTGDIDRWEQNLVDAQRRLDFARQHGASQEVITQLIGDVATAQRELELAGEMLGQALEAGWIKGIEPMTDETLAQITGMIDQMNKAAAGSGTAFAESLLDEVVEGVFAGRVSLEQALEIIPRDLLDSLEEMEDALTVDLAEALLTGADNAGLLQEQLEILIGLMDALKESANEAAVAVGTFIPGKGYYNSPGVTTTGNPNAGPSGGGNVLDKANTMSGSGTAIYGNVTVNTTQVPSITEVLSGIVPA